MTRSKKYDFQIILKKYPNNLEDLRGKKLDYALKSSGDSNYFLRRFIIHRDNYTCQECGFKGNFNNLVAHHIKHQEIFNPDLLVTLCNRCHSKVHRRVK